jgi:hypothetical protein
MTTVRMCRECRWAALEEWAALAGKEFDETAWRCTHPRSKFVLPPNYVTGSPVKPVQLRCYLARGFSDFCGPQGQYWEAR